MTAILNPKTPAYGEPDDPVLQHLYLDKLIEEVEHRKFTDSKGAEHTFQRAEAQRLVWTRWRHSYTNAFEGDTEKDADDFESIPLVHHK